MLCFLKQPLRCSLCNLAFHKSLPNKVKFSVNANFLSLSSTSGKDMTDHKNKEMHKEAVELKVATYNILAQVYVKSNFFPYAHPACLRWKNRAPKLVQTIKDLNADIICFQELDEFEFHRKWLKESGFGIAYSKRPDKKKDGSAVAFKENRFQIIKEAVVHYNDLVPKEATHLECGETSVLPKWDGNLQQNEGKDNLTEIDPERNMDDPKIRFKRDCVGIMVALKEKMSNSNLTFIVASTHLFWDPKFMDVKIAQAKFFLDSLESFKSNMKDVPGDAKIPIIVGGDFNSQPGDPVYQEMTKDNSGRSFHLKSAYALLGKEPSFTTHTPGFTGTLDYVFVTEEGVDIKHCQELPGLENKSVVGGLPNWENPSDHLPLLAELKFGSC